VVIECIGANEPKAANYYTIDSYFVFEENRYFDSIDKLCFSQRPEGLMINFDLA
jgi:hypothetical protein